jgi:hypothetical protein
MHKSGNVHDISPNFGESHDASLLTPSEVSSYTNRVDGILAPQVTYVIIGPSQLSRRRRSLVSVDGLWPSLCR